MVGVSGVNGFQGRVAPLSELSRQDIDAWDDLCLNHVDLESPFLSPHYALTVAACRDGVRVCVLENAERRRGYLPFQYRTRRHAALGAAERVGGEMTDYFGLVAPPEWTITSTTLLQLARLRYLSFTHLDESQLRYGLNGEQPEPGHQMQIENSTEYWEDVRRRHKNYVKNTERARRQIEAQFGPLRFTAVEAEWETELRQLLAYKSRQYRQTGGTDMFATPWKRMLLERLVALRHKSCTGVLSTLYAGDTWIASHFGIRSERVLHYWFPVYNPSVSRFSPGHLLIKCLLDVSGELGIRLIDYGGGTAFYKSECCNRTHTFYRGVWSLGGVRSTISRIADAVRWRTERLGISS